MVHNKKGISPLIATVLLIGFTVAMAALVSTFVINQTKTTFNPENLLEDSSLCDQMVLGAVVPGEKKLKIIIDSQGTVRLQGVYIQNKGAYAIRGLIVAVNGSTVEVPYIFDERLDPKKRRAADSLLAGLEPSPDSKEQYVAPGKVYKFGDTSPDDAGSADSGTGIPLPKSYAGCETGGKCFIKVYPIIWDFEKEKASKCIKSQLEFDYAEICKSYNHKSVADNCVAN